MVPRERGDGDAAYVITDFSSGRMVTMSSASRILAMPRFASAVSKACVVSVSSKLVAGGLLSSTLVRLRGVEALGRDGIRVDQRAAPAEAKQRVARGRGGGVGTWLRLSSLLVALRSEKLRRSGRKALMSALKAMPFCHGVGTVVSW